MITGMTDEKNLNDSYNSECSLILTKPVARDEFEMAMGIIGWNRDVD
jgi:hypothetical protein